MDKPILELSGSDGNAFAVLGKASKVARQNNIDFNPIRDECMKGDYNHLLQTLMEHFEVE